MSEGNRINKKMFIAQLADELNYTRVEAARVLDAIQSLIISNVCAGDTVQLTGFGTFVPSVRKGYAGNNPKTGKPMVVEPIHVPRFKPGQTFKRMVRESLD